MLSNYGAGEDSCESFGQQAIKPVNPKRNQPWIFIERTYAEADTSILWPLDENSQFIAKDPDVGKDWGQKKKERATEDEMVGWHHWLNGHGTLGDK